MSDLSLAYPLEGPIAGEVPASDEAMWVDRARRGDLEAFDEIMARYESRLLRFLIGLVSDTEVARELCQDTFLAAYQALPRVRGELRLSAWLHTIAINRARSYHRHRRLRTFLPLQDDSCPVTQPDLQESIATRDAVQQTLDQIPLGYAHALLLQVVSGLSCREIGEVLGCSEGAAKIRLLRAREAFRQAYEGRAP